MKNIYALFTLLLVTVSGTALAQTAGLRGGVTVTSIQGEAINNLNNVLDFTEGMVTTSPSTGFFAGGYVSLPIAEGISIEPGLYFAQKGSSLNGALNLKGLEFLGANVRADLQSSYIDAPLLARINLSEGLQLFAGPQVSYLVKNNLNLRAGALGFSLLNRNIDVTDNFKKWDVAVTGGLAYQFAGGFNIQAGYEYGLSRIDANSNLNSYNTGVKVGIGFTF